MVNDGHTRVRQETLGNHVCRCSCTSSPTASTSFIRPGPRGDCRRQGDEAWPDVGGGRYAAVRPLIPVDADNEGRRRLLADNLLSCPKSCRRSARTAHRPPWTSLSTRWSPVDSHDGGEVPGPHGTISCLGDGAGELGGRACNTPANPTPLWLQHPEKHYWHAFLEDGQTLLCPVQPGRG